MITQNSFTIDWINQVSKRHKADKILVEKSIRALSLLEGLSESSLPFVFKGGTALMLIFKEPHRLSIDIDITIESLSCLSPTFFLRQRVKTGRFLFPTPTTFSQTS